MTISIIWGWLAGRDHQTIVHRYWQDLNSETMVQIQGKELRSDDAYPSNVIDDKKSWFTCMDVLDSIYIRFFCTTNSLGCQPTTSPFFQPPTPQMLALVAAAIHCMLSKYATGKKVTVTFSQDEYQHKFLPFTVIDLITAEATTLINYTFVGLFIPPHGAPPPI